MKTNSKWIIALPALLAASAAFSVDAQTASGPQPPEQSTAGEQTITMSPFEVATTQGHGYTATNAATAFFGDQPLMDIPQGLIVVSSDMIKDIDLPNSSDTLEYAGASSGFQGESIAIRGGTLPYPYIDGFPDEGFFHDNFVIDSYELIEGPAEVFYPTAGTSGLVLENTKRPLPYNWGEVTFRDNQWGVRRATFDSTGPAFDIGDAKVYYRLLGVYQRGNTYFINIRDNRDLIMPELEVKYHNTDVRVYWDFQRIVGKENGQSLLAPDGSLYAPGSWRNEFTAPNSDDAQEYNTWYAEITQNISSNWAAKFSAEYFQNWDYSPYAQIVSYDWAAQTATWNNSLQDAYENYYDLANEWTGHYDLGPGNWEMSNRDSFGATFAWQAVRYHFWTDSPYNSPQYGWTAGGVQNNVPLTISATNQVLVPPTSSYSPPANSGSGTEVFRSIVYYEHVIDAIPNWLTLSGSWSWADYDAQSISNLSEVPWTPTVVPVAVWLHRLGAIFHATKAVSIYALDSTTFTAPSSGAPSINSTLLPPGHGEDRELGAKTSFFNGKLSAEVAWFRVLNTNVPQPGGFFPNGERYFVALAGNVQEGVNGDVQLSLTKNWQLVGTFYKGHVRSNTGAPVDQTYDNSWSVFTRYDFGRLGPFSDFAVGGGANRIGGVWIDYDGLTDAPGYNNLPDIRTEAEGTMVNAFAVLELNQHWSVRLDMQNLLDQEYPLGSEGNVENVDPSPPPTVTLELSYRWR